MENGRTRAGVIEQAFLSYGVSFMLEANLETYAAPENQTAIDADRTRYVNQKLAEAGFTPIELKGKPATSSPAPQSPEV